MLDEAKVRAVLQKVRAIEVRTRKVMNEGISGSWRSHFKGRGMNFEELRDYTFLIALLNVQGGLFKCSDWRDADFHINLAIP